MNKILKTFLTLSVASGLIFTAATAVSAEWTDMNYLNPCNTKEDIPSSGAELIDDENDRSPDGTAYLKGSSDKSKWLYNCDNPPLNIAFEALFSNTAVTSFSTWETDIKFSTDYSGFSMRNSKGATGSKVNTTIVYHDGALHFSNGTGTTLCEVTTDDWYHIKLTGIYDQGQDNSMLKIAISKYNTDGTLTDITTVSYPGAKYGEIMRNNKAPTRFAINPGTCVDNIRAYKLKPVVLETVPSSAETLNISAGEDIQFTSLMYADADKKMKMSDMPIVYELWNADKTDYLISDTVTITPQDGLLSIAPSTQDVEFTVVATCTAFPEFVSTVKVSVAGVPMLKFEGVGFDEDYTTLVNLKYTQNYENEGDTTFVIAFYDENGRLLETYSKNLAYRDQANGTLYVTFNKALPKEFDPNNGEMKVYVWSKTTK